MKSAIFFFSLLIMFFNNSIEAQVNEEWVSRYNRYNGTSNTVNRAESLALDDSGNVYVTGQNTGISISNYEYLTIKYNSSGDTLWTKSYDGPANSSDRANSIVIDSSGYIYVSGFSTGIGTGFDYATIKYNAAGDILWVNRYNGPGNSLDQVSSMAVDNSGNVYVTGKSVGIGSNNDYATIKYNSAGVQQWVQRYNGTSNLNDNAIAITLDIAGNVYVTGYTTNNTPGDADYYTIKYNTDGVEQWVRRYNGSANRNDQPNSIIVDNTGNVIVTGTSYGISSFEDITTILYTSSGNEQWVQRYNGPGNGSDVAITVKLDGSGNIYVGGNSNDDFTTIKYSKLGIEQWVYRYNGSASSGEYLYSMTVDKSGNVYQTGRSSNLANYVFVTVKFNAFGEEQWVNFSEDEGSRNIIPNDIEVDESGNIYITGTSLTNGYGIVTFKYSELKNRITGMVYFDYNMNDIFDGDDGVYTNGILESPGLGFKSTSQYGNYYFYLNSGQYEINIPNPPRYYYVNPDFHSGSFSPNDSGLIHSGKNFALKPVSPDIVDVRISLVNINPARPGRTTEFDLVYENVGISVASGEVRLVFDNRMTFENSSPAPETIINDTLKWSYSGLKRNERRIIKCSLKPFETLQSDDTLKLTSKIYQVGDAELHDNVFVCKPVIVNSHDPNDITVNPSGNITPLQVAEEDSLTYTIRFQNIGTASAIDIRVVDTLSSLMNISSFQLAGSSHDFTFNLKPGGIAEWKFDNINLPDSTTDEPGSHGYIQFRVEPKNDLNIGDEIRSTAHIYFDFNQAVVTNTAVAAVALPPVYLDLKYKLEAMYPVLDTVTINLRSSVSPYNIIESAQVVSTLDVSHFSTLAEFANIQDGSSYYIEVTHRNSIATWSANPVLFSEETTVYDFTSSLSQAFENNMILSNGVAAFYSGDVNQDGSVDNTDQGEIYNDGLTFSTGYLNTDLTGDGIVDNSDIINSYSNGINFVRTIRP